MSAISDTPGCGRNFFGWMMDTSSAPFDVCVFCALSQSTPNRSKPQVGVIRSSLSFSVISRIRSTSFLRKSSIFCASSSSSSCIAVTFGYGMDTSTCASISSQMMFRILVAFLVGLPVLFGFPSTSFVPSYSASFSRIAFKVSPYPACASLSLFFHSSSFAPSVFFFMLVHPIFLSAYVLFPGRRFGNPPTYRWSTSAA